MHRFQPTRASPPAKSLALSTAASDVSSAVAPELQHLSTEDIDILDAVIQRAGPSANTFFTVFKAYSDVLKERGLHPQEVVYYGKLLKLGTMKGKNWGDKWEMVKAQLEHQPLAAPSYKGSKHDYNDFQSLPSDIEASYEHGGDLDLLRASNPRKPQQQSRHPLHHPSAEVHLANLPQFKRHHNPLKPVLEPKNFPIPDKGPRKDELQLDSRASVLSHGDDGDGAFPVPPSYKSTAFESTFLLTQRNQAPESPTLRPPLGVTPTLQHATAQPKVRKDVLNLDDAWKNIKMEQDEKFADKFRQDMLLARCWEVWRQGFQWITTTHRQIGEARDTLLLRLSVQRWQDRLASRHYLHDQVMAHFCKRYMKSAFRVWQAKMKQKRQAVWRQDMRQKMKFIKGKSDLKLKKDAWAKWRQLLLSHRADKRYRLCLIVRRYARWKMKLAQLDSMDIIAEEFSKHIDLKSADRCWDLWRRAAKFRHDELIMIQRIDWRIMTNVLDLLKRRMEEIKAADVFRKIMAAKNALRFWKDSLERFKAKNRRATKHVARQDNLLLRAVIRVWRARMRGRRFEQFRSVNILKDAWAIWKVRCQAHEAQLSDATKFQRISQCRLASNTLSKWSRVLSTHRNALEFAVKYDQTQLYGKALLLWRLRLREAHQSVKVARWADRFFATRRAWRVWLEKVDERKRQERLRLWNTFKAGKVLNVWRRRARQEQYLKRCELVMKDRLEKRFMSHALAHWTNRVIEIKSHELNVSQRRALSLQRAAFHKWKACRRQHAEEISLLENHLLVKQEDILRKAFHHWLTARRSADHRRQTHQRKEDQVRQTIIVAAWEKWREVFMNEKLRPLEYEVILQNQKNTAFRAFDLWLSKTHSLPAIRFHSKHTKEKFFKIWKNGMPQALRARTARDADRHNTLSRYFEKWAKNYRTKITLKAVARAKYLRLPVASSRASAATSRPVFSGSRNLLPRRSARPLGEDKSFTNELVPFMPLRRNAFISKPEVVTNEDVPDNGSSSSEYAPSVAKPASVVRSIVSMTDRRSASPTSRRGPSSVASGGAGGSRLWSAIKEVGQIRPSKIS